MSIIKNYGLYWSRDLIKWGKQGQSGTLEGWTETDGDRVDFRDQAGIYILYEGHDIPSSRITYVGQAESLFKRLKQHSDDHLWNRWNRFSWFGMYEVGKAGTLVHVKSDKTMAVGVGEAMDHLEGLLITILDPLLNKRGANWGDATQYYQPDNDHENAIVRRLQALELSMAKLKKDRGT